MAVSIDKWAPVVARGKIVSAGAPFIEIVFPANNRRRLLSWNRPIGTEPIVTLGNPSPPGGTQPPGVYTIPFPYFPSYHGTPQGMFEYINFGPMLQQEVWMGSSLGSDLAINELSMGAGSNVGGPDAPCFRQYQFKVYLASYIGGNQPHFVMEPRRNRMVIGAFCQPNVDTEVGRNQLECLNTPFSQFAGDAIKYLRYSDFGELIQDSIWFTSILQVATQKSFWYEVWGIC